MVKFVFAIIITLFICLVFFNSNNKQDQHIQNVVQKGYTVYVRFLDDKEKEHTLTFETKTALTFEIVDNCLVQTTGINQTMCCNVSYIQSVLYKSHYDGRFYTF